MTEQKGIDILAKAIELISKNKNLQRNRIQLQERNDEQKLKELNKYSNCNYIGFEKEVTKFYQKADLMLVPSRWEGFPYTILEAQSTGTPVITTNTPGCKRYNNK